MFVLAWLIERLVLRHLVNQEGATLLMATLGITYFLDGLGQTIFGSDIYKIDVGMPKDPIFLFESMFEGGVLINQEDVIAALVAAVLVSALSLFFQKTATGRALLEKLLKSNFPDKSTVHFFLGQLDSALFPDGLGIMGGSTMQGPYCEP